jgi:hypothetical protein
MRTVHANSNKQPVNIEDIRDGEDNHPGDLPTDDGDPLAQRIEHPHLTGMCGSCVSSKSLTINPLLNQHAALPCDRDGGFLPAGAPPNPRQTAPQGDWTPFNSEIQFKVADLLYRRAELSAPNINALLELWAESLAEYDVPAPFNSHEEMYSTIDSCTLGDVPWQCLVTGISEDVDEHSPDWMRKGYEVWYRDPNAVVKAMLDNPDFDGQFDLRPYIDLDASGKRRWNNLMSGNLAWRRCVSPYIYCTLVI